MRTHILFVFPLAAVFGCAHQSSDQQAAATTPTASPPAVATTTPPPAESTPPPGMTSAEKAPDQALSSTESTPTIAASTPHEEAVEERVAAKSPIPCPAVRIQFAFDSDVITDADKPLLDEAAQCLSTHDRLRVSLEGNADEIGPEEYNKDLGARRAAAVARYLEDRGVKQEQLQAIVSHGEDNPACDEKDATCYARNRRTAIRATCHL